MNIQNIFNAKGVIIFLCTLLTCTFLMSMLTPKEVSAATSYETLPFSINGGSEIISGPSVKRAIPDADWLKVTAVQGSTGDTHKLTVESAHNAYDKRGYRTAKVYLYDANVGGNLVKVYTIKQTVYSSYNQYNHTCESNGKEEVTQEATCKTTGKRVTKCKWCEKVMSTYIIPIENHNYEDKLIDYHPNCESTGKTIQECTKCGDTQTITTDATGHNYVLFVETVKPKCTTSGYDIYKCSNSGCNKTTKKMLKDHIIILQ